MPARPREAKEEKQSKPSKTNRTETSRNIKEQQLTNFTSDINSIVLEAVQKSIQSASVHAFQRKRLLQLLIPASTGSAVQRYPGFEDEEVKSTTISSLRDVVLNRLPIPTAADSLKRFTLFLSELCKNYGRETKALSGTYLDDLPATIIECLVGYHNAKDKQVRLMVCTLIQALLVTLADTVPRDALYAALTNALKDRCFDKCPLVREKAIGALKAFHLGEKEDDVTQVSIALLCEDVNAKVREGSVLSIPKCRSVHLRHLIRMTKDIHSSVRRACWESLATYNIKDQLLGYCQQLGIDLFDVAASGLKDPSEPVRDACRNAISVAWLQRGFGSDLPAMVEAFFKVPTLINLTSATSMIRYLITTLKEKWTPISISINPLTPANATLWRCSVLHFLDASDDNNRLEDNGGTDPRVNPHLSPDDDSFGLPLLSKFRVILTAVVNQYAGKTPAPSANAEGRTSGLAQAIQPEDVKVPCSSDENKEVAFVIDLLLSVFDIYHELGLLGHADDNGRNQMIRPLGFLLKVVTIDKPVCFVDDAVKSIKAITERHEGEGRQSIESALRTLFSLLAIPKRHQLSYEDIEAYSRVDMDRRRRIQVLESQRLQDGEDEVPQGSEEDQLLDDVSTDDAVMTRMCRIVHAYLSCLLRGTDIPPFVTHIIQLGRSQRNIEACALAMRCLSLHCLINPQTVTTFLPIFMNESSSAGSTEVAVAAASGLFDMMSEYGPKFFDNTGSSQPPTTSQQQQGQEQQQQQQQQQPTSLSNRGTMVNRQDAAEQQRIEIEKLASVDDSFKPGSQVIVKQMFSFLQSPIAELRHIAIFGFCKLLAANRLLQEACVPVLSRLMHFYVTFEASAVDSKEQLQMHRLVEDFFRSFSFSHPRRQGQVLDGGLLVLRLVLDEHVAKNGYNADVPKVVSKILKRTVNLTDAINVQQVRDVDPDLSAHVAHQSALEVSRLSGTAGENGLDESIISRASRTGNNSSSIGNRSITIRLWRELGKCSLHERLSLEVLAMVSRYRDGDNIVKALIQELPLLRLYKRDVRLFDTVRQHTDACKIIIRQGPTNQADELCALIDTFVDGAEKIKATSLDDTMFSHNDMNMSFGGVGTSDDGFSLVQRDQARKALADAVNKIIVPVKSDGVGFGWLADTEVVKVAAAAASASQGTTKATGAKGGSRAKSTVASSQAAKVKEEFPSLLQGVVKRPAAKRSRN